MQPSSHSTAVNFAPTRVLVLGGSTEATALAQALVGRRDVTAIVSLAGRTRTPAVQPLQTRVGGFGGVAGLAAYLRAETIDVLVDATHPFAATMTRNAREAAKIVGCPLVKVSRRAWAPQPGDRWREVATMAAAAAAIGAAPRRVFLTVGSLHLNAFASAVQHHYLVRTIDPVERHALAIATFLTARGPFDIDAEDALMRDHRIEMLVTKNSGGAASAAKLTAARRLGLPVILVRRPRSDPAVGSVADAMRAIEAHVASRVSAAQTAATSSPVPDGRSPARPARTRS